MLQQLSRQLQELSNYCYQLQSIAIRNIIWLHQLSVLFAQYFNVLSVLVSLQRILVFPCGSSGIDFYSCKNDNRKQRWNEASKEKRKQNAKKWFSALRKKISLSSVQRYFQKYIFFQNNLTFSFPSAGSIFLTFFYSFS